MTCPRCAAWMLRTWIVCPEESAEVIPAWRCWACGELVDAVILAHRAAGRVALTTAPQTRHRGRTGVSRVRTGKE